MSDTRLEPEHGASPAVRATAPPRITRRRWLKRAVAAAAALGAGIVVDTFWIEPHWLEVVRRDLPIRNLPRNWQGRTLMQISDVHVGNKVSDAYLIRSFQLAVNLVPDVVVVTGDFVSCSRAGVMPADQARRIYAHLPQGRFATLGVLNAPTTMACNGLDATIPAVGRAGNLE